METRPEKEGEVEVGIDLTETFECGQIYGYWTTSDGEGYATSLENEWVEFRETDVGVKYRTTDASETQIERFLSVKDSLDEVYRELRKDETTAKAVAECEGLRILQDDFFRCTVSFIASTQSTVERTRSMVRELCEEHGETREGFGSYTFPSPEEVVEIGEDGLREAGFGYRAPYIEKTARSIAESEVVEDEVRGMSYRDAHTELKKLTGVGDKVADCILLFSLGFREVVALDTWLNKIIDEHYPEARGEGYRETADGFRGIFGEYTGYAQTYLYHYKRKKE